MLHCPTLTNIVVATIFLALGNPGFAKPPDSLRPEHLGNNTDTIIPDVTGAIQDWQGFMWFTGSNGLARYDGYEFKIYRNDINDEHSISSSYTRGIHEDSQGDLWVITFEGLNLFNREQDNFTHFNINTNTASQARSNLSHSFIEDSKGRLWIGTYLGINIFDKSKREFIDATFINKYVGDLQINRLFEDSSGNIWIGTQGSGIFQFQSATGQVQTFAYSATDPNSISSNDIKHFVEDDEHNLWIATTRGIDKMDPEHRNISHYRHNRNDSTSLSENYIWYLFIDSDRNLWVATDSSGLNVYNKKTDSFQRYQHDKFDSDSLGTNKVRHIYEDKNQGIWISSVNSGIDYISHSKVAFDVWRKHHEKENSLVDDEILTIHEDPLGRVWVGTEGGLSMYNPNTKIFTNYKHEPENKNSLRANAVLALQTDKEGQIWIGTWSGGLSKLNPETGEFQHYLPADDKLSDDRISSQYIWSLHVDSQNQLWIGTEGGYLDVFNPETKMFKHYGHPIGKPGGLSSPFIRDIIEDEIGAIWVATDTGVNVFSRKTESFSNYQHINNDKRSLLQNNVWNLFQDSKNNFWVATDGGLSLFDRQNEKFTHFTQVNGLINNSVFAITEDANGMLWVGTLQGLSRFNYSEKTFRSYTVEDGLAGNTTNRPAILYSNTNGKIYVGSTNGVSIIDPRKIVTNANISDIVFTNLKVNNKVIDSFSPTSPLQRAIGVADSITLNYEHKMISISFSSLEFGNQQKAKYRYKLEGFDKDWIETQTEHSANYTNLPSGRYKLLVTATDANENWRENSNSIDIKVLPPWWSTTVAYIFYFLSLAIFIFIIYRMQSNRLLFEKEKVAHFKYIDKIKNQILANTSHELRTPLNGIIGLAEALSEEAKERDDYSAEKRLNTITSSGKRLANLVNDILDFSKLEQHSLSTAIVSVDLNDVVKQTFDLISPLIGDKNIEMINKTAGVKVYADEQKLQQILLNLASNAVKFTDSGYIKVEATSGPTTIIMVSDTGVGIPPDQLENIFESFQQVSSYRTREHGGTGLGLAITKKLLGLLGGEISVESKVNKGTVFSIALPGVEETFENISEDENSQTPTLIKNNLPGYFDIYFFASSITPRDIEPYFERITPHQHTILVVDDDPVNRMVLAGILIKKGFNVIEAVGGHEALEKVSAHQEIDMLVLDIMMPRMSGFEVCEQIRSHFSPKQLPILFLSANSSNSEVLKAFELGGNDFSSKPIQHELLLKKIYTWLTLRVMKDLTNIQRSLDPTTSLNKINQCLHNGLHHKYGIQVWLAHQNNKYYVSQGTNQEKCLIKSSERLRDLFLVLPESRAINISSADIRKIPEFKAFVKKQNIVYKSFTRSNLLFVLLCYGSVGEDDIIATSTVERAGKILTDTFNIEPPNIK